MSWIGHIQSRYSQSDIIVQDRLVDVEGCEVDLRSFPEPNVVLWVDQLIKKDEFVKPFSYHDASQKMKKRCDLIVIIQRNTNVDIFLIEAKKSNLRKHQQRPVHEAIDQLRSSKYIFDAVLSNCSINLDVASVIGIAVTTTPTMSEVSTSRASKITRKTGMIIQYARCGEDVWKRIHGMIGLQQE